MTTSHQTAFTRLRAHFAHENVIMEGSLPNLSPVDIFLPDRGVAVEVQGSFHFLDANRQIYSGRTLLKRILYEKQGIKVIEIMVCEDAQEFSARVNACIAQIERTPIAHQARVRPVINF